MKMNYEDKIKTIKSSVEALMEFLPKALEKLDVPPDKTVLGAFACESLFLMLSTCKIIIHSSNAYVDVAHELIIDDNYEINRLNKIIESQEILIKNMENK